MSNSTSVIKADPPEFQRVDRSLQTAERAKPARPEVGIASDASWCLSPNLDWHGLRRLRLGGDGELDRQQAAVVASLGLREIDVVRQMDQALERAVLDLDLLVGATLTRLAGPLPQITSAPSVAVTLTWSGSIPASSTTTVNLGGSSLRKESTCGRKPRRRLLNRETCHRSPKSSSISFFRSLRLLIWP